MNMKLHKDCDECYALFKGGWWTSEYHINSKNVGIMQYAYYILVTIGITALVIHSPYLYKELKDLFNQK